VTLPRPRIAILGGGPGGYEAALVAAQLGADVTVVDADGPGGSCVLTDCVPSKTLIESSSAMTSLARSASLGLQLEDGRNPRMSVDAAALNARIKALAAAQSHDIAEHVEAEGVQIIQGRGRLADSQTIEVDGVPGAAGRVLADVLLVATGATPRVLPDAVPDGERILTWRQIYDLPELPEDLIVVGSGVTGAEFASAYQALGSNVSLVSSRERVLPHEDKDAAVVIEDVFRRRGMNVISKSRAEAVHRKGDSVVVTLADGRVITGSHCLMTVGMIPSTSGIGLAEAGVRLDSRGFVEVDRVSRTSVPHVYAAGDCTGVLLLASVAAMQGRIAMWHALGEAVQPIKLSHVASTIFTDPEIASVGVSQAAVDRGEITARVIKQPLATNPRAKMGGFRDGFVKIFARPGAGMVLGGVVVAPRASELILPLSIAIEQTLSVDQIAHTFSVYPSLSGSITEAARSVMEFGTDAII
jgi:pyruvate/2-oxoglutarate dehydrogenase complex dihydrolipoamide dehydrogenase (E3) component